MCELHIVVVMLRDTLKMNISLPAMVSHIRHFLTSADRNIKGANAGDLVSGGLYS